MLHICLLCISRYKNNTMSSCDVKIQSKRYTRLKLCQHNAGAHFDLNLDRHVATVTGSLTASGASFQLFAALNMKCRCARSEWARGSCRRPASVARVERLDTSLRRVSSCFRLTGARRECVSLWIVSISLSIPLYPSLSSSVR